MSAEKFYLLTIRFEKYHPVCVCYQNHAIKGSVSDFVQDLAENHDDGIYVLMFAMEITKEEFKKIDGWVES